MPRTGPERPNDPPPPSARGSARAFELQAESFSSETNLGRRVAEASEAELLALMAGRDDSPSTARAAWGELYERHAGYLFVIMARALGNQRKAFERIHDVVMDTFQAAYDWAARQSDPAELARRFGASDADETRRRVLGWLTVIARRVAASRTAESADRPIELRDDMHVANPDEEPPSCSQHAIALQDALGKLNPAYLDVLLASLPWYEPDTRRFVFPRGEAERIASNLGTSPGSLRQRRHRAMKRLKALVQAEGVAQ